jgi:hypothetical protein
MQTVEFKFPFRIMFDFWNLKFKIEFEFGLNTRNWNLKTKQKIKKGKGQISVWAATSIAGPSHPFPPLHRAAQFPFPSAHLNPTAPAHIPHTRDDSCGGFHAGPRLSQTP